MAKEYQLPFLEQRPYLHGTTLFDLLVREVPAESSLSFKIAKIIHTDRISIETGQARAAEASATLKWQDDATQGVLCVLPLSPSAKPERVPYDESRVTRIASVEGSRADFSGPAPYSFIAIVVPLFKELLSRRAKPLDAGQWMFTRLDLDHLPSADFLPLRLELDRASTSALARCSVTAGARCRGQLYFSWVRR